MKKANFGRVSNISKKSVTYSSTSWSELSKSVNIAMYTIVPGTMESVEHPSITLGGFEGIGMIRDHDICPHCNLPMDEHELQDDFIEKIKRREKNKCIRIKDIDSLFYKE